MHLSSSRLHLHHERASLSTTLFSDVRSLPVCHSFPFRRTHSRTHLPALCLCDILCYVFSFRLRDPSTTTPRSVLQRRSRRQRNSGERREEVLSWLQLGVQSLKEQITPTRKVDGVSIDSCFRVLRDLLLRFTAVGLFLLNIPQHGGRRKWYVISTQQCPLSLTCIQCLTLCHDRSSNAVFSVPRLLPVVHLAPRMRLASWSPSPATTVHRQNV